MNEVQPGGDKDCELASNFCIFLPRFKSIAVSRYVGATTFCTNDFFQSPIFLHLPHSTFSTSTTQRMQSIFVALWSHHRELSVNIEFVCFFPKFELLNFRNSQACPKFISLMLGFFLLGASLTALPGCVLHIHVKFLRKFGVSHNLDHLLLILLVSGKMHPGIPRLQVEIMCIMAHLFNTLTESLQQLDRVAQQRPEATAENFQPTRFFSHLKRKARDVLSGGGGEQQDTKRSRDDSSSPRENINTERGS